MKIVYVGSVLFSARALEKLISIGADIVGIITKKESLFNSDFFDLSSIALTKKIPFRYTSNINNIETVAWIKHLEPDVIFCFGWSNLIKKEILESSHLGVIGFHPSLLPYNRGRHPLIWAKTIGLKKTGSTFFFMDEGADTGDIISQREFEIDFNDDALVLYEKMITTALVQIEIIHEQLKDNTFKRIKQDKNIGNSWRKRNMKDGLIDFRMSTSSICNLVRGLSRPYIGAHLEYRENCVKVWQVDVRDYDTSFNHIEPGKVLNVINGKLEVKTEDSSIWLIDHEFIELPLIGSYIV